MLAGPQGQTEAPFYCLSLRWCSSPVEQQMSLKNMHHEMQPGDE